MSPYHRVMSRLTKCSYPVALYSNAYVVAAWRQRGKDKKDAANFGYTTLLPDNIPQSINLSLIHI